MRPPGPCVIGIGSYLPKKRWFNRELPARLNTSDAWIQARTGIHSRYVAAEGELTSDLASHAARAAIANANLDPFDIDLIVLATSTPDLTFPATAAIVQAKVGIGPCAAFDLQAVCSGFVYAISVVDAMFATGNFRNVLVIGAETFSRILDWEDRSTCVLFGDGAGAIVLSRPPHAERSGGAAASRGIVAHRIMADGRQADALCTSGGVSTDRTAGMIQMNGRHVYRAAIEHGTTVIREMLDEAMINVDAIDWFVPHQANLRIMKATCETLGIPEERLVSTVGESANTSAASIPLALDQAVRDGRIAAGDLVLIESVGAGLTWGSALIRW